MATQTEINNVMTIAVKEFNDNIKSKRFILVGILYLGMALLLTGVTILLFRNTGVQAVVTFMPSQVLSLIDILNIILALLAIIVTADTISMEKKDRTLYQLLSKPVERSTVIIGKFLGCLAIVSFLFILSSALAYVLTAIGTGTMPTGTDALNSLEAIIFLAIMFAVYVGIGILISTVTKNPLISIISGVIVWIALFFSNTIGTVIGSLSADQMTVMLGGDAFSQYPLYAKVLIWINPISHDSVSALLNGGDSVVGMPIWANVVILLVFTGILLFASVELFNRQDI